LPGRPCTRELAAQETSARLGNVASQMLGANEAMNTTTVAIRRQIADLADAPVDRHDLFLRLFLLSARHAKPGTLNLGDLEMYIPIAWTSAGPCLPEHFEEAKWRSSQTGHHIDLHSIYHVPRMTDYVMPPGVRIMNTHNVRLGAYLSPGT